MSARSIRTMERERDRLLAQLQAQGGRGIDLAEDIDEMNRDITRERRALARWHAARARYGERAACALCDLDIEYGGKTDGWHDRGGVRFCDEGGAARYDGDGIPVPFPHRLHKPAGGAS